MEITKEELKEICECLLLYMIGIETDCLRCEQKFECNWIQEIIKERLLSFMELAVLEEAKEDKNLVIKQRKGCEGGMWKINIINKDGNLMARERDYDYEKKEGSIEDIIRDMASQVKYYIRLGEAIVDKGEEVWKIEIIRQGGEGENVLS